MVFCSRCLHFFPRQLCMCSYIIWQMITLCAYDKSSSHKLENIWYKMYIGPPNVYQSIVWVCFAVHADFWPKTLLQILSFNFHPHILAYLECGFYCKHVFVGKETPLHCVPHSSSSVITQTKQSSSKSRDIHLLLTSQWTSWEKPVGMWPPPVCKECSWTLQRLYIRGNTVKEEGGVWDHMILVHQD